MSAESPKVDLTHVKYDALETALTQMLGLKVILVRDWETPDAYYRADSQVVFAQMGNSQQKLDDALKDFRQVESAMLGSLRANIADRDPIVGCSLSENDLRSLEKVHHITLRRGNAEPEEAVIIFDPASQSKRFPEKNPALSRALGTWFDSAWKALAKTHEDSKVPVEGLIENFDIDAQDIRAYQAMMHVRYALQNQHEYSNKGKGWYYQPQYYNFAALADSSPGIYESNSTLTFAQTVKKLEIEEYFRTKEIGIQDPDLMEKLKLAGAVRNLVWNASMPSDTFARLGAANSVTPQEIHDIQKDLSNRLRDKLNEHRDIAKEQHDDREFHMGWRGLNDWRILFPIFREVYEADKSTGYQRLYLDTIMTGLQKWFPTLTNGPVPDLDIDKEPPRNLPKAKRAPSAPKPKP